MMNFPDDVYPTKGKVIDTEPCTRVLKYHHIGVAVTDISATKAVYEKLGFKSVADDHRIMVNSSGMGVHLLQADEAVHDNQNLLQDFPTEKYCGHTHACFAVASVPACKEYLVKQGLEISGERGGLAPGLRAVFIRDPNRITYEFEKMLGEMQEVDQYDGSMIGNGRRIDHVGTRVSNSKDRWQWYAEKLGFVNEVMHSKALNPDPLKNNHPWIGRTDSSIDINLLLNANMPGKENKLLEGGVLKTGILYAAFEVANLEASTNSLKASGVSVYSEEETSSFVLKPDKILKCNTPSAFVLDPDHNIYRLVHAEKA